MCVAAPSACEWLHPVHACGCIQRVWVAAPSACVWLHLAHVCGCTQCMCVAAPSACVWLHLAHVCGCTQRMCVAAPHSGKKWRWYLYLLSLFPIQSGGMQLHRYSCIQSTSTCTFRCKNAHLDLCKIQQLIYWFPITWWGHLHLIVLNSLVLFYRQAGTSAGRAGSSNLQVGIGGP
jgi:hypothetical protein